MGRAGSRETVGLGRRNKRQCPGHRAAKELQGSSKTADLKTATHRELKTDWKMKGVSLRAARRSPGGFGRMKRELSGQVGCGEPFSDGV